MSDNTSKPGLFAEIPTWMVLPAVAIGAVMFEVFHHFGLADAGRVAGFSSFILFGVAIKCRPFWRYQWFWLLFFLIVVLHAVVIATVQWPESHYPALLIAPFSVLDFFLTLKVVEIAEKYVWNTKA